MIAENAALRAELAAAKSAAASSRRLETGDRRDADVVSGITHVSRPPRRWRRSRHGRLRGEARIRRVPADEHRRPGVRPPRGGLARGARAGAARRRCSSPKGSSNEMLLVAEHGMSSGAIMDFALNRDEREPSADQALAAEPGPVYVDGPRRASAPAARGAGDCTSSRCARMPHETGAGAAAGRRRERELRSRNAVARPDARQAVSPSARAPAAGGDAVRPGADAALQHHQRGHRSDPADRHRRQADHREPPRGKTVRRARRSERRLAPRRRRSTTCCFPRRCPPAPSAWRRWRGASCCWSIRSKAPTCCSSCSVRAPRTSARAPTSSRSCATSPTWRARRKRSRRATGRCGSPQAEVRDERHRLDLIIDSVADPILVTDQEGDIVLMNTPAERLFNAPGHRGRGGAAAGAGQRRQPRLRLSRTS